MCMCLWVSTAAVASSGFPLTPRRVNRSQQPLQWSVSEISMLPTQPGTVAPADWTAHLVSPVAAGEDTGLSHHSAAAHTGRRPAALQKRPSKRPNQQWRRPQRNRGPPRPNNDVPGKNYASSAITRAHPMVALCSV